MTEMPLEPTPAALKAMWDAYTDHGPAMHKLYRALYDQLARPPSRTEFWITGLSVQGLIVGGCDVQTDVERETFVKALLADKRTERVIIKVREVPA